ncbi:MAG: TetR/AcrR family transcriptional regulator [Actinobacteria bacterium]|nr:MAG: TetR/AcrR family transcriptional regulator [Actinomycetota bacterium]
MSTVARKREARIERIHDAAAALFAERGYHATRMQDVAEAVDMQKGSLYYYFSSKEDLLVSLVESRVGAALDVLRTIVGDEAAPEVQVRSAIAGHLTVFQERADVYTIFNSEKLHSISRDTAVKVDELGREYERLWADLLSAGIAAGAFRRDLDVTVTVKAVLGMCNATLTWFRPGGRLTIEEVADRFSALVLEGIS